MKRKNQWAACILCMLYLFTLIQMVEAGVEPSPFKMLYHRILSLSNELESIHEKLIRIDKHLDEGNSKITAIINQLESLNDRIMSISYWYSIELDTIIETPEYEEGGANDPTPYIEGPAQSIATLSEVMSRKYPDETVDLISILLQIQINAQTLLY